MPEEKFKVKSKWAQNAWRIIAFFSSFLLAALLWTLFELRENIKDEKNRFNAERAVLAERIQGLQELKVSLESKLETLERQREVLLLKIGEYEEGVQALTAEIDRLKIDLEYLDPEVIYRKDREIEDLKMKIMEYEIENERLKARVEYVSDRPGTSSSVELSPITVVSDEIEKEKTEGEILEIDKEHDFVIVNLGEKHGIAENDILFTMRKDKMLGRIIVERVQENVSVGRVLYKSLRDVIRKGDKVIY